MNTPEIKAHNLSQFAQDFYSFKLTSKSTAKNPCLSNGADHIVIKRQQNNNYTFFSPDTQHRGSIIDFVMWQENVDVKNACKIALEKITGFNQDVKAGKIKAPKHVEPVKEFDQDKRKSLKPIQTLEYLEGRGINNIDHGRFKETVFSDERNNAVFPHKNEAGKIVGYAMKNNNFNGFSPGGSKTIWKSRQFGKDNQLVITESAIDALSYAKLINTRDYKQMFNTRFISTEGGFSPEVQELIKKEVAAMPKEAVIVAAFDNDKQGLKYVDNLETICKDLNRDFKIDIPKVKDYDWNKVLVKSLEREKAAQAALDTKNPEKEHDKTEDMECQM